MNRFLIASLALALAGGTLVARAQVPSGNPDPAFLTKAIQTLQQQRNNAQDQLAAEQARRLMVEEENTKLKGELEKKPASGGQAPAAEGAPK